VPVARASRELLAPPEDVWQFLVEPRHLADWWPGIGAVEPDRRGLAHGARWRVRRREASLFRRAQAVDTLLVVAAERPRRFAFELVQARLQVELDLAPVAAGRTLAELSVEGPFLLGFSRSLPKTALAHLHDLCQTTAIL
jgi:uncharacterized protein YndB with AHSA1/START domain